MKHDDVFSKNPECKWGV